MDPPGGAAAGGDANALTCLSQGRAGNRRPFALAGPRWTREQTFRVDDVYSAFRIAALALVVARVLGLVYGGCSPS